LEVRLFRLGGSAGIAKIVENAVVAHLRPRFQNVKDLEHLKQDGE